jgi:hypothetical protein
MTMRAPIHLVGLDEPPLRVFRDARAAFRELLTSSLLPLVSRFDTAYSISVVPGEDELGDDVLMFKDDEVVVFLWSRRVPGGSRLIAEVFGGAATTIATLRRPARRFCALVGRRGGRFESATVATGPACLVIDTRADGVVKTWHSEWVTL